MRAKIRYDHWIPKLISRAVMPILAITLYPFILVRDAKAADHSQDVMVHHEAIHLAQYRECWVVGFFLRYLLDYLVGRIKYKYDHKKAYLRVRYEQEAYEYQAKENYLMHRAPMFWKSYKIKEDAVGH